MTKKNKEAPGTGAETKQGNQGDESTKAGSGAETAEEKEKRQAEEAAALANDDKVAIMYLLSEGDLEDAKEGIDELSDEHPHKQYLQEQLNKEENLLKDSSEESTEDKIKRLRKEEEEDAAARIKRLADEKEEKRLADEKEADRIRKEKESKVKEQLIEGLVAHCSGSNHPSHDNAATIDNWHARRGWGRIINGKKVSIGYHWFIRSDGTREVGRPIDSDPYLESKEMGAHVLGENRRLLGVCLHGLDVRDFTEAQYLELAKIFEEEILKRNPEAKFYGHNYFTDKKTCPNFDWFKWGNEIFPDNMPEKAKK